MQFEPIKYSKDSKVHWLTPSLQIALANCVNAKTEEEKRQWYKQIITQVEMDRGAHATQQ